jgi:hypothetical protein
MENVSGSSTLLLLNLFLRSLLFRDRSWFSITQCLRLHYLFNNYFFDYCHGLTDWVLTWISAGNFTEHLDVLICSLEFFLQTCTLSFKFINQFYFGIHILIGLILDKTCFSRVIQSRDIFFSKFIRRRQTSHHQTVRISTQRLLE